MDNAIVYNVQVLLTRELKSCTDFKNLKTLTLGEWCITPGFDVLAAMLGHSPNLENLFLQLDMVCKNLHAQRILSVLSTSSMPKASSLFFLCIRPITAEWISIQGQVHSSAPT